MAEFDTSYEYDGSYGDLPAIHEGEEDEEDEYEEDDYTPPTDHGDGHRSMAARFNGNGSQIDPALMGEDRKYSIQMERSGGEGRYRGSMDSGRGDGRLREGTFDDATSTVESEGWEREGSSKPNKRMKMENKTCDNCRKRKIKCKDEEGEAADPLDKACEGCRKLGIECTFEYIRKRPGRKNGFLARLEAERLAAVTGNSVEHEMKKAAQPPRPRKPSQKALSSAALPLPLGFDTRQRQPSRQSAQPPRPSSSFAFSPRNRAADLDLSWLDAMIEGSAAGSFPVQDTPAGDWSFNDQAQLLALESPENASQAGSAGGTIPPSVLNGFGRSPSQMTFMQASKVVAKREPQLEDVTTWANISHFISLFLQYLYPLLPLVHRPTFAEHLATRRDLRDSDFRALLLSIVAYVISQLPTSRLVNDQFDVDALKRLQRRCHRTCKSLQRTYYGPTNLTQIATIIFDMFYLLSIGLGHTAASRLGQAVQLAYSMGLHSDERTMDQGLDCIEIQLRRRVFWQLYASDKTRAIPGAPMLINDFQGVCSYPAEVDDEFITAQGGFPQPAARTSVLCGFVTVSKVFRFLSECFFHHRCVTTGMRTIPTRWTEKAEERLNRLVGPDMPEALHHPESVPLGSGASSEVLGMQRANILITAAIAKFALYDLRAALNEVKAEQLAVEREKIAKEIHECLMTIPMEELASNGESVRGKVFHIACALCVQGPMDGPGQEVFKSFCEMFSAITFVQMPVPPPGDVADSSANSPLQQ